MSKQILVNASSYETRVAILEDGEIRALHIEREEDKNVVGNVYKGVVKRVLPGMQAAFLELGLERTAFLYVDDIIDEPFGRDVDYMDEDEDSDSDSDSEETAEEEAETAVREEKAERDAERFSRRPRGRSEHRAAARPPAAASEKAEGTPVAKENVEKATPVKAKTGAPVEGEAEVDEEGGEVAWPELEPSYERQSLDEDWEGEDDEDLEDDEDEEGEDGELADEAVEETPVVAAKEKIEAKAAPKKPSKKEETAKPAEPVVVAEVPATKVVAPAAVAEEKDLKDIPKDQRPRESRVGNRGGRDEGRGEPRGRDEGRGEPRGRDEGRGETRGRDEGRGEPRGRDEGRGEPRGRDEGRGEPRGRDEGRGEPRGRDEGRGESRGHEGDSQDDRPRDNEQQARDGGGEGEPRRGRSSQGRGTGARGGRDRGRSSSRKGASSGRRPPRRNFRSNRRPRGSANIQDLLKEGQEILVQVAKAPIGTKGARLTTHISLPGRNLVLMPTTKHLGISRRIQSDRERRRLRDIFMKRVKAKEVGFIIRTVAEGKSIKELGADADYLQSMWAKIKRESGKKRAPALIHEDLSLAMRTVRDFFTDDVDSFVIDNEEEYENVIAFIEQFMPRLKDRVKLFKGPSQLFEHFGIESEISRALGKKVWLKSGGYLLIDQSEALTAIDVNTGRYVGSKSLEETILRTNLEAVKEVAYQLRIRNVGGIIIIDLIDMESMENREKVYHALQDALGEDKAKTNILKISELGLVEMTRKRTHEDLVRYLTEGCGYCEGRGYHKSKRTVCFEIFREIEKEAIESNPNIMVFANPEVAARILKEEHSHVEMLEERFKKHVTIRADVKFHVEQYEVFGKQ